MTCGLLAGSEGAGGPVPARRGLCTPRLQEQREIVRCGGVKVIDDREFVTCRSIPRSYLTSLSAYKLAPTDRKTRAIADARSFSHIPVFYKTRSSGDKFGVCTYHPLWESEFGHYHYLYGANGQGEGELTFDQFTLDLEEQHTESYPPGPPCSFTWVMNPGGLRVVSRRRHLKG